MHFSTLRVTKFHPVASLAQLNVLLQLWTRFTEVSTPEQPTMLDHFSIFNRNGVMLWSENLSQDAEAGGTVNDLVRYVLLEERAVSTFDSGKYQLKWTLANELDLVFVVVFNKIFAKTLTYLDELLAAVKLVRVSCLP